MDWTKWSGLAQRRVPDPKGISPAAVSAAGHRTGARRPGGVGVTSGPQGQSERGALGAFSCVQFDRPEKTSSSQLIQPRPIKHLSSNTQAVAKGAPASPIT
jgi:hypothetical protein